MPRIARIGTTAIRRPVGEKESYDLAMELVRAAGASGCDLVLLPEGFYRDDKGAACIDRAKVSRVYHALAALAAQYEMYVLAGMPYWEGDIRYNGGVLFDRAGEILGAYKKIHLTEGEIDSGISPGSEPMVFDLDFGRVGVMICFDINWRDEWRILDERGAELVCWLSAYDGGFPLQAYASTHTYYVVSSVRSMNAKFIDITGRVLNKTGRWTHLAVEEINFERTLFEIDDNWQALMAIQERYGTSVAIRGYSEEDWFTLEPTDDRVTVAQLIEEYGLEPNKAYCARVTKLQDEARARMLGIAEGH